MRLHRKIILTAAALTAMSQVAAAADLPARSGPYTAPMYSPAPVTTWSGFYVGANVGYGWENATSTTLGVTSNKLNGVIGGGQLGYNWQTGNLLLGIEGDFQGSGQSNTQTIGALTIKQEAPWFGTLRGRIGYANGPWLIYGTGGAAWQDYKITLSVPSGASASSDTSKSGWTGGGGVEWMFMPQWSAKLEYLYMDTGNTNTTLFGIPITGRLQDNIVRVGANYHF